MVGLRMMISLCPLQSQMRYASTMGGHADEIHGAIPQSSLGGGPLVVRFVIFFSSVASLAGERGAVTGPTTSSCHFSRSLSKILGLIWRKKLGRLSGVRITQPTKQSVTRERACLPSHGRCATEARRDGS